MKHTTSTATTVPPNSSTHAQKAPDASARRHVDEQDKDPGWSSEHVEIKALAIWLLSCYSAPLAGCAAAISGGVVLAAAAPRRKQKKAGAWYSSICL